MGLGVIMAPQNGTTEDAAPLLRHESGERKVAVSAPAGMRLFCFQLSTRQAIIAGTLFIIGCSFAFGFGIKPHSDDPQPWRRISAVIGWLYFFAWSVSFYPQTYLNHVRRSVVGMSFDYQLMNLVGFTAYSVYNVAFYYDDSVRHAYFDRHGEYPVVRLNDVVFALHALVLTIYTFGQIFSFHRGDQKLARYAVVLSIVSTAVFILYAILVGSGVHGDIFDWLDYLIGLSFLKLGVTLIKYYPQALLNFRRKTTIGFNIYNVALDFSGGFLSVLQLLIDCGTTGNWQGIAGDPVKFALGFTSMVFDVIFMTQHFYLYADNNRRIQEKEDAARVAKVTDEESPASLVVGVGDAVVNGS